MACAAKRPLKPEGKPAWAKAFNDFFRDYQHMLAWHAELADKYGIVLHYKRGATR